MAQYLLRQPGAEFDGIFEYSPVVAVIHPLFHGLAGVFR